MFGCASETRSVLKENNEFTISQIQVTHLQNPEEIISHIHSSVRTNVAIIIIILK